jgi:hypothetical protein
MTRWISMPITGSPNFAAIIGYLLDPFQRTDLVSTPRAGADEPSFKTQRDRQAFTA